MKTDRIGERYDTESSLGDEKSWDELSDVDLAVDSTHCSMQGLALASDPMSGGYELVIGLTW